VITLHQNFQFKHTLLTPQQCSYEMLTVLAFESGSAEFLKKL